MNGGDQPLGSGPDMAGAPQPTIPEIPGSLQSAATRIDKERNILFWFWIGWCASHVGSVVWKARRWPELHLLGWGNAVVMGCICLATYRILQMSKKLAVPLPWMKAWVRWVGFMGTTFLVFSIFYPVLGLLDKILFPTLLRAHFNNEAAWLLERARVAEAGILMEKLSVFYASACGFAFLLISHYFKARPPAPPPRKPNFPPVPRDEWWKKYY